MTARDRLLALRQEVIATLLARALLGGLAAGLATLAIARAAGWPDSTAVMPAIAVFALMALRTRAARSVERVALWVEERHPSLRYALVTAAGVPPSSAAVNAQAMSLPWRTSARRALGRALVLPAAALTLSSALVVLLPRASTGGDGRTAGAPIGEERGSASGVDVLASVRVVVEPPAYTGRRTTSADDPTSVEGFTASLVTVSGQGDAARVGAFVDSVARVVHRADGRWSVRFAMPARPALVRLRSDHGSRERLIVLAPVADAPPTVTLLLPARDTVMRRATGVLLLRAQLRDDIGLRDAGFEVVISSGQDENFTFRSATIARASLGGASERMLEGRLSLDSLALKPGDVLQLRAVARDANVATGPGVGSSETRALRVARAGEYDSLSINPAPPPEAEGQMLSQRMLIMLTEALEKRRRRLARPMLMQEAGRIAGDQARLRKRVGDIVFQRTGAEPLSEESSGETGGGKISPDALLKRAEEATAGNAGAVMDVEGDETPILALSKPLLEAYNAMWDAGRALEQGETDRALPPMRRALAAIERARQAERIYLRGRPSAVVVDVARARLAGKDKGTASVREARAASDPRARRRALSFEHATALLGRDPSAAADTLLVLRIDALDGAPALAAALDDAARALRRGDAGALPAAWQRVRRALGPAPVHGESIGLWSGAR